MLRNLGFIGLHRKRTKLSGEIDKMIGDNTNASLEDILSEETVIDELESQNKYLIEFLDKEKIKQMIDYIIKEPPSDASHDKGHKFPWICSKLFNLGIPDIMKYFLKTNKELEEEKNNTDENASNENNEKLKANEDTNKNETMYQKEKDNKIELLDYLFSFLSSNTEPNYVLCGYFTSLIKILLSLDQKVILKYLYFERKDFIRQLINHSYRQSIAEILSKIIQYDSNEDEFNVGEMALIRMEILEELFEKIDITMDTEKLDSISTLIKNLGTDEMLLNDMLNNKKIIECLVTRPFKDINLLINDINKEELINTKRRNFNILIDVIISWINSINSFDIDLPSTEDDEFEEIEHDNTLNHTILSYELFHVLENLIKVNFNKNNKDEILEMKIIQCFDEKPLVPLGLFRIKIVDLLSVLFTYFKNIPQLYDKLLIDSQFFENVFIYLFEYELNNIYQESLLSLFKQFLMYSEDHPLLADFIFTKLKITETIISKLKEAGITENADQNKNVSRFSYKSGNTTTRGYIAFLISLSYRINTIIGGEPLKINNTLSREGSMTFTTRAAPFVGKEEINKFYGMEEDELYEALSNESGEARKKCNCAIASMEKYLNDEWKDYFNVHIADKIKLYETKLYKEERRDSVFRNPFVFEGDDENGNNKRNFGLGEDEDSGPSDYERFMRGEVITGDIDINVNRFKMSMRLPRNNKNTQKPKKERRGSVENRQIKVDEIDNFDTKDKPIKKDENKNIEENPLDKLKKVKNNNNNNNEEENPLDKLRKIKNNDNNKGEEENPLYKLRKLNKNKDNNKDNEEEEENPLDKLRKLNKKKDNEDEEENPLDKLRNLNKKKDSNKDNEEEEENPLDKLRKLNKKKDNEEEEENPLDKLRKKNNNNDVEKNPLYKLRNLNKNKNKIMNKDNGEEKNLLGQ